MRNIPRKAVANVGWRLAGMLRMRARSEVWGRLRPNGTTTHATTIQVNTNGRMGTRTRPKRERWATMAPHGAQSQIAEGRPPMRMDAMASERHLKSRTRLVRTEQVELASKLPRGRCQANAPIPPPDPAKLNVRTTVCSQVSAGFKGGMSAYGRRE